MSNNEIRFDRRVTLLTGAGRGLGRAQALLLASRGARVVVADNGIAMDGEASSSVPADAVVAEITAAGGMAVSCTADIATDAGAVEAVEACLRAYGRIDAIVHNASTSPDLKTADKLSDRDLDLVMRVNPIAGLKLARAAWPHMVRQKYGRIVYMTSGGIYGALGNTDYAAAKSAYIGIVRCLALEGHKDNILVNAVAPSARTRMTERFHPSAYAEWFFRTMLPEKVAVGVAYLVSDACSVHGEMFSMGGGRIGRISIAETEGVNDAGSSVENIRDSMPAIMADNRYFFPKTLAERSLRVAQLFGFDAALESSDEFAVRAHDRRPP